MTLQEFKEKYSKDEFNVLSALLEQVKNCTGDEFGYLSDVIIPKGVAKKEFDSIIESFKKEGIITSTSIDDGYAIDNVIMGYTSKKQEIRILKSLIDAGGYFAEYFKADFKQMKSNIENDHPIEFNTLFYSVVEIQRQRGDDLIAKHVDEKRSLCETMLCVASETGNERLYERVVEEIGLDGLIKLKHVLGLEINQTEIKYLISKL